MYWETYPRKGCVAIKRWLSFEQKAGVEPFIKTDKQPRYYLKRTLPVNLRIKGKTGVEWSSHNKSSVNYRCWNLAKVETGNWNGQICWSLN